MVTRRVTMRFIDGTISETDAGDARRFRITGFTLYDLNLPLDNPQRAAERIEKPEKEMPLSALRETIAELGRQGQIVRPFEVELHKRFSLPVAALVFILVGFPLGIRSHRGGRTLALGSSLAVVAAYYVIHTFLEGVALRGAVPVWVAMWLPNAIFGVMGLLLLHGTTAGLPASWSRLLWRLRAAVPRGFRIVFPRRPAVERGGRPAARPHGPRASTYIIDRYLVGQYLTFLGTGAAVASVLILVVDLIQYLDKFLRSKPPFIYIVQHLLYRLPGSLHEGLPIIVLVSTVFLFVTLTQQPPTVPSSSAPTATGFSTQILLVIALAETLAFSLLALGRRRLSGWARLGRYSAHFVISTVSLPF